MYEAHYGLNEKPFRKTPDPRYLFLNEVYEEASSSFAVEDDLALLTGEVAGQTAHEGPRGPAGDKYEIAMILNPPLATPPHTLAGEIGVSGRAPPTDLVAQVHERLLQLDEAGRAALLIVDEAHLIPGKATFEEIRLLTNFQLDDRNLIAVLLVGQPELRERLRHRAYRALTQRIGAQFHLTPLRP
jgi:type II secretory pathway predicted ATPase ExeA